MELQVTHEVDHAAAISLLGARVVTSQMHDFNSAIAARPEEPHATVDVHVHENMQLATLTISISDYTEDVYIEVSYGCQVRRPPENPFTPEQMTAVAKDVAVPTVYPYIRQNFVSLGAQIGMESPLLSLALPGLEIEYQPVDN